MSDETPALPRDPDYLPPSTNEGEAQPIAEHEAVVIDTSPVEQPVIADPLKIMAARVATPDDVQPVGGALSSLAALIGTPQVQPVEPEPEPEPKTEIEFEVNEQGTFMILTLTLNDTTVRVTDFDSSPALSDEAITALRDILNKRAQRMLTALLA